MEDALSRFRASMSCVFSVARQEERVKNATVNLNSFTEQKLLKLIVIEPLEVATTAL